jgi:hypothetical protein
VSQSNSVRRCARSPRRLSGGERPTITRYVVANGIPIEDGVIDFANDGLPCTSPYIDDWGNTFISPDKAYLSNSSDVDEGREGAALGYVSGGRAVFAAFYDESVAIALQ